MPNTVVLLQKLKLPKETKGFWRAHGRPICFLNVHTISVVPKCNAMSKPTLRLKTLSVNTLKSLLCPQLSMQLSIFSLFHLVAPIKLWTRPRPHGVLLKRFWKIIPTTLRMPLLKLRLQQKLLHKMLHLSQLLLIYKLQLLQSKPCMTVSRPPLRLLKLFGTMQSNLTLRHALGTLFSRSCFPYTRLIKMTMIRLSHPQKEKRLHSAL